jgi:hypothetical protein
MRSPRPGAAAAAAVFAVFGLTLVWAGLARPGAPPVRSGVRWVPAEALVEAPASSAPSSSGPAPSGPSETSPVGAPVPAAARPAAAAPETVPQPVTLEIPSIGVRTALDPVGRDAAGSIDVPPAGVEGGRRAYWYRDLVRPGAVGPAVIVGHVDSRVGGPAVFYRLGELARGDVVTVRRADGSAVRFVVQGIGRYLKSAFPGDQVYAPTTGPTLRLITCGGAFDRSRATYLDNLVVFATAAA